MHQSKPALNKVIAPFSRSIGLSLEGRAQMVFSNVDLSRSAPAEGGTLVIGGTHGDEAATVLLLEKFIETHLGGLPGAVAVLPLCNPDSYANNSRYNARGVDLNRNCGFNWHAESVEPSGAGPWSEPEICALRDFILEWRPSKIVSLHWALAEIDADGHQSTGLARAMWESMSEAERGPYRLRVTEPGQGQRRLEEVYTACPGSLGQWCGYALGLESEGSGPAMITLELPYDPALQARPEELPEDHLETLRELWGRDPQGYLAAVEGPVFKMLLAACGFGADAKL